ncbi:MULTISPECIES: serine hydrolase [Gordonia]|jgi:hypothetical protein|nr:MULTISPECIES: hypothetical protein [Gordonia]MBD0020516.1 hypothetical protein [Gordonia sp. (in: high G+C Gram-positive bacteria)]
MRILQVPGLGAVLVLAMSMTGCSGGDDATARPTTSTVTVTASATPAHSSVAVTSSKARTPNATSRARLVSALDAAIERAGQPVGVAIVPVGRSARAITAGDQTPMVAWSTIKVPVAVASERANGQSASQTPAIVESDNAAAEHLWSSLGSDTDAAAAVTEVLRDGGDTTTTVPSAHLRSGFTIFGQTTWPLRDAAAFTAHLPCMAGTEHVLSLMGQVAGNQQWGVEAMASPVSTAVKGGWGPGPASGYVVRQIGLITHADGTMTAVAMGTSGPSLDSGIGALNTVAQHLDESIRMLPRGRC